MTVQAEAMPARENAAPTFGEAFRVWLKIGCINFGGPAGQIAMMHRMLVDEKKWIDEPRFLHALNFCMLLPGPEAQKLATYVGWALHGVRGGLVAGILFVLPGALVMLALSLAYALGRGIAWIDGALFGIKAAVLVIVVEALLRISRRALKTRLLIALAGAAFIGIFFLNAPFPLIVAGAALIGYLVARTAPERMGLKREAIDVAPAAPDRWRQFFLAFLVGLIVWWAPVLLAALALGPGHVLVSIGVLFQARGGELRRCLRAARLHGAAGGRDASLDDRARDGRRLGLAETTPGPLILVTQFVGFLAAFRDAALLRPTAGILGAAMTTWVTFTLYAVDSSVPRSSSSCAPIAACQAHSRRSPRRSSA